MLAIGLSKDRPGIQAFEIRQPEITDPDEVLVKIVRAGICGTDRDMVRRDQKDIPPGEDFIILGHEAMGRVELVGPEVKLLKPGDLVVPTVRRGCGQCPSCLNYQSDMCSTGNYTERGIHKAHGYLTEYIVEHEPYLVSVPEELGDVAVLTEPLSISEKALTELRQIQLRLPWHCPHVEHRYHTDEWGCCKTALVIGAGPIGFLGTCLLRLAGVKTYVSEIVEEDNIKIRLVKAVGGIPLNARKISPRELIKTTEPLDIILEASGASELAFEMIPALARNGIYVWTGVPRGDSQVCMNGDLIIRQLVRNNQVIIGSINSNREHFISALDDLRKIKEEFSEAMEQVITHRFRLKDFQEAFALQDPNQLKVIFEVE